MFVSSLRSAHGMIGYTRGMICFACTTDFLTYIKDNKLQIAQNTCDALFGACSPVYAAYKDLIEQMIKMLEDFLKRFNLTFKLEWKAGQFRTFVMLCDGFLDMALTCCKMPFERPL